MLYITKKIDMCVKKTLKINNRKLKFNISLKDLI
jgi:hypothetical protein